MRGSRLSLPGTEMDSLDKQTLHSETTPLGVAGAVQHLEQAISSGKHWYIALLEAIKLWDAAGETWNERTYCYLIDGEAFDWLLLAERLTGAVDGMIPNDEKTALLFYGEPPLELPSAQFKELIGSVKHHQHLNYFYGVTVEEALIQAVQEEVRKEKQASGYFKETDTTNEAYRRIYGSTKAILLRHFRKERSYPQLKSIGLTELKEFTYWSFKYRFKKCDKARVASDTKKGLNWLENNGFVRQPERDDSNYIEITLDGHESHSNSPSITA